MKDMIVIIRKVFFGKYALIALLTSGISVVVYAASVPYTFQSGTTIRSNAVNENFTYLADRSLEVSGNDLYHRAGDINKVNNNSNTLVTMSSTISGGGYVGTYGANGSTNVSLTSLSGYGENGYLAVYDEFDNVQAGIYINSSGEGVVFGDTKSFRMKNPNSPDSEIWYACPEGPEAAAYIRGTAQLQNGSAIITIPDHFRAVASPSGITVTLTPLSASSNGLAVVKKGLDECIVQELANGSGNYEFDYFIMAVRGGHEDFRVIRSTREVTKSTRKVKAQ